MMTMCRVIRDRRGVTALEFTLILLPLLMFIIGIFDASRYAPVDDLPDIIFVGRHDVQTVGPEPSTARP